MKISIFTITLILVLFSKNIYAQSESSDKGNLNIHFGTLVVYNTYSIGYESFDLIKKIEKHQFRPVIRIGGWNSSFINKNSGILSSFGVSYLFGKRNHYFEHSSEVISHFDKGLKGQPIVYIASLYRLYFGYRYQPNNKKIIVKIGIGWKEFIQVGLGYRF